MIKPKIIVICGPTASGKSDLAVWLAKKMKTLSHASGAAGRASRTEVLGEIISADSRQVYKGLDIGSGKVPRDKISLKSPKLQTTSYLYKGVSHHLLDIANPKRKFTVYQYKEMADKAILDIMSRGKVPIICGGTGFYIDTVVKNLILPDVPADTIFRKKIEGYSKEKLFQMLQKLDPVRATNIDINNKVRMIRAIEVVRSLGKVPVVLSVPIYESLSFGINLGDEILKRRIRDRLLKRIKSGMVREVENLHKRGLSWRRMEELGLEYRYVTRYLQKKISRKEMTDTLCTESWHYAKRQMTWFRRDKGIVWVNVSDKKKILHIAMKFLKK